MFDFFRLKSTIGRSYNTDFGDVLNTKKALNGLGFYNKPDYGMTKYPDRGLFDGIGNYQKSRGLKVDGLMKPNGETARSISADIGRRDEINRRPSIAGQMRNIMARREGISKQDVITGNDGQVRSGSPGSFVPVKPPSRSRVPNPFTPIVRAEPTAAPSPWWQSSAKVSGEAHASNNRTLDGLLKYSVNGDLPNLFASAIKEAGKPAVAELGNFMRQLDKRAPERTRGFESQVFNKLGNHQKATHFPEVFNRPQPRKPTPPKPASGLDRGATSPEIKGWLDKSLKKSNTETMAGRSPAQATGESRFNQYQENLRRIEGGDVNNTNDPGGLTSRGIAQKTFLEQYNKKYPDKNLPNDPRKLTDKQITNLYREEFYDRPKIEKLANVSGLEKAAPRLAEQVYDSGVLHGTKNAGQWLQKSLDEQLGTDLRVIGKDGKKSYDGNIGPNTRAAVERAVREGKIKDVNNSIVGRRQKLMRSLPKYKFFKNNWEARALIFNKQVMT